MNAIPLFTVIWLAAMIVFAVVEAVTVGALVSIWFALGSLAALIVSRFTDNFWVQLVVFLVVSCITFALVRPLVKRYINPRTQRTNADRLVGQEAIVTQTIDNLAGTGQASIAGQVWTARGEDNTPIEAGARVTVLRIEGVKLIVRAQ